MITGNVVDGNRNIPIENVNVSFKNTEIGVFTNVEGQFKLMLPIGFSNSNRIVFSFLGYTSLEVSFAYLKKNNFLITLFPQNISLGEVVVKSNKQLQPSLRYTELAKLEKGVYAAAAVLVGDLIYVFGGNASYQQNGVKKTLQEISEDPKSTFAGFISRMRTDYSWSHFSKDLQMYDILNDTWTVFENKTSQKAYHKALVIQDTIYFFGGIKLSSNKRIEFLDNTLEEFVIDSKMVSSNNFNPHQAINFGAASFGKFVIAFGGSIKENQNKNKQFTDKMHLFNTETQKWFEFGKLTIPKEVNGILVGNSMYAIGGFHTSSISTIEKFDLSTLQWETIGNLPKAIDYPALASYKETIYMYEEAYISTFNIKTKVVNKYVVDFEIASPEIFIHDEKLIIIGGYIKENTSIWPSERVLSINLDEFLKTRIFDQKTN